MKDFPADSTRIVGLVAFKWKLKNAEATQYPNNYRQQTPRLIFAVSDWSELAIFQSLSNY